MDAFNAASVERVVAKVTRVDLGAFVVSREIIDHESFHSIGSCRQELLDERQSWRIDHCPTNLQGTQHVHVLLCVAFGLPVNVEVVLEKLKTEGKMCGDGPKMPRYKRELEPVNG